MAYKKVRRVVTLEFMKEKGGSRYDVVITPETVVVRYKDTVVWDVQGLPPGLAKKIGVGNLKWEGPAARVRLSKKKGLVAGKPKVPAGPFPSKSLGGHVTVSLDLGTTEPGCYKYDLLYDGVTLVDPEIEIRGPKA